jgi:hypothetical protein
VQHDLLHHVVETRDEGIGRELLSPAPNRAP